MYVRKGEDLKQAFDLMEAAGLNPTTSMAYGR